MRISDWSSDVCSSDLAVFVKPDLGQLALSREDRYLFDGRVEPGAPFLNMALEIRFDGERQWSLPAKRRIGGRGDEVAVELANLAAARDPYASCLQPLTTSTQPIGIEADGARMWRDGENTV